MKSSDKQKNPTHKQTNKQIKKPLQTQETKHKELYKHGEKMKKKLEVSFVFF